jgi:hypothetical protein
MQLSCLPEDVTSIEPRNDHRRSHQTGYATTVTDGIISGQQNDFLQMATAMTFICFIRKWLYFIGNG